MRREYPETPIVGVAAAVFVDRAVLLVRRNQEPARGQWSLPGGVVELGESHVDALQRELWEELSVTINVGGLVGVLDKIFRDREGRVRFHYVLVDYWARIASGRPKPATDVDEAKWAPLSGLNAFGLDHEQVENIMKAWALSTTGQYEGNASSAAMTNK